MIKYYFYHAFDGGENAVKSVFFDWHGWCIVTTILDAVSKKVAAKSTFDIYFRV